MKSTIQQYMDDIDKIKNEYANIVIYGAGRKAISLCKMLESKIKIDAFIVTNKDENKDVENNLPIVGVNKNSFAPQDTLVLIGVRTRWNDSVVETLKKHGFLHYIESPDGIEYLGSKDADRSKRSVLQVTLQIGCAINCKYCPQSLFVKRYKENSQREDKMNYDMFVKYLDGVTNDVILEFAGFSEPFFNKDCVRMLEYADEKGYDIELFTTLQGLNENDLERVLKIPYREVVLHIPDEKGNSNICINDDYIRMLEHAINYVKADGTPFADWGSCHGEPAEVVKPIVKNKLRILTQLHDRAGNLSFQELESKSNITGKIKCSGTQNFDHNVLLPDGTVLLCDSDWGMQHILGNLKQQTYREILSGDAVREIKKRFDDETAGDLLCRSCCYAIPVENNEVKIYG